MMGRGGVRMQIMMPLRDPGEDMAHGPKAEQHTRQGGNPRLVTNETMKVTLHSGSIKRKAFQRSRHCWNQGQAGEVRTAGAPGPTSGPRKRERA